MAFFKGGPAMLEDVDADGFIHPIDPVIMRAKPEFVGELKLLYY